MDPKSIQSEISKDKVRSSTLKKRSKFLKEWRDRYFVLKSNFLFIFMDDSMNELN